MLARGLAVLLVDGVLEALSHLGFYPVLGSMLGCIFLQIKWLNHGLQHFDALYVIPVFQAFWIGFGVVAGLIVYRESEVMSWTQLCLFACGVSVTLMPHGLGRSYQLALGPGGERHGWSDNSVSHSDSHTESHTEPHVEPNRISNCIAHRSAHAEWWYYSPVHPQ